MKISKVRFILNNAEFLRENGEMMTNMKIVDTINVDVCDVL